jgi:excisionase family DNA binding protein
MRIFTTVQCAEICGVSARTVCKWFDSGRLRGYRIPGSQDRRIPGEFLVRFLREQGMPVPVEYAGRPIWGDPKNGQV